jgi:UDP-N-acetylmuramoyl-tripeptide--D-alanyl-D-alanine ligase
MDSKSLHSKFLSCVSVATDTRKIEPNVLFFALKGSNFDGNTFALEALKLGASYVVIDNADYYVDERTIVVSDTLIALQELATYHRNYLSIPIIALTGSNGKTTTKELFQAILSKKFNSKATVGNLNNHIGVPLTLLSFTEETEIGIVEMGANHQKEIEFLCSLAQPDYGYITNFGKAHLEGFGGVEGVIAGKSEMYRYLKATNRKVFVNLDDAIQSSKTINFDRITFSQKNSDAFLYVKSISANPFVNLAFDAVNVQSNLIGLYNATNIMAALTVGKYFGVSVSDCKSAIESYFPDNNRSQLLSKNTNEIILDAYNANPSSMEAALTNFIQLDKSNKIIIIGDMFELGEESLAEHKKIVHLLDQTTAIDCYLIGKDFFASKVENPHLFFFEGFDNFSVFIKQKSVRAAMILIKGSRGMALERTLNYL